MHFAEDGGGGVVEDVEVWHFVLVEEGGGGKRAMGLCRSWGWIDYCVFILGKRGGLRMLSTTKDVVMMMMTGGTLALVYARLL